MLRDTATSAAITLLLLLGGRLLFRNGVELVKSVAEFCVGIAKVAFVVDVASNESGSRLTTTVR